ncbi:hypothetical protein F5Y17DRAFT_462093 [Xylariaceae sp. FL0594]|nr:hypothetical protein F5Y17DRAFT_462093 [Xylariaceae sp. FL0594]
MLISSTGTRELPRLAALFQPCPDQSSCIVSLVVQASPEAKSHGVSTCAKYDSSCIGSHTYTVTDDLATSASLTMGCSNGLFESPLRGIPPRRRMSLRLYIYTSPCPRTVVLDAAPNLPSKSCQTIPSASERAFWSQKLFSYPSVRILTPMTTTSGESGVSSNYDDSRTGESVTDDSSLVEAPPADLEMIPMLGLPGTGSANGARLLLARTAHVSYHPQDQGMAVLTGETAIHSHGQQANAAYGGPATLSISIQNELLYGVGAWTEETG